MKRPARIWMGMLALLVPACASEEPEATAPAYSFAMIAALARDLGESEAQVLRRRCASRSARPSAAPG